MILGVSFLVLANVRQRPGPVNTAVSVVVTVLGALAFVAAYTSISS